MPLIFRVMTTDHGKPLVANVGRGLGVRIGNGLHDDIAADNEGRVHPGKGMSVAPAWRLLPLHRIPRRLGKKFQEVAAATGKDQDACWRMGDGLFENAPISGSLTLIVDGPRHGVVGPAIILQQEEFVFALAATRDLWTIDEE